MERKNFAEFEFKALDDDALTITGYGSVFGNLDSHGDIVQAGAFLNSKRKPKMLWQHRFDDPIGVWTDVKEDNHGLHVTGKFANTQKAMEVRELIKIGAVSGLSIGYRTLQSEDTKQGRVLKELDLYEISIVTLGSNELATIDTVKAAEMTKRELEDRLRDSGFSSSVAKKIISGGYNALQSSRDVEDAEAKEIEQFNELKKLLTSRVQIFK